MADERSLIDQLETAVEAMLRGERVAPDATMGALMGVASDLRDLPRESFLARLGQELSQEGDNMLATQDAIQKEVREGFRTVTPYIVVKQVTAIAEFLKQAFGAEQTFAAPEAGSGGGYHFEFRLGHSMLMVGGSANYPGPEVTPSLHYFVGDVDAAYRKAMEAGATSTHEPVNQPFADERCAGTGGAGGRRSRGVPASQGRRPAHRLHEARIRGGGARSVSRAGGYGADCACEDPDTGFDRGAGGGAWGVSAEADDAVPVRG
jgi:PhnB protein